VEEPHDGCELSGTELLLLALCTANFGAMLRILQMLGRVGLLDETDLKSLHDDMSSAIDAAGSVAPAALAVRTQTMIDLAMVRLLDQTRSPAG